MGVKFKVQGGADNPAQVLSFTDDFATDRILQLYGNEDFTGGHRASIGGGVLTYASVAGTSGIAALLCFGARDLQGQTTQFIKATMTSVPSLLNRSGLSLYGSGRGLASAVTSDMHGYYTHMFTGTINLFGVYPGVVNYTLALALGIPAQNDVFELLAEISTASTRVRLWQNGTVLADVTDADANRPLALYGWPGLMGGGGAGSTISWDNMTVSNERV